MKAQVLDRPSPVAERPLRLVERVRPTPRRGEVLVEVRACGICRTDLHVVEGELPVRLPGVVPGHQVVGEVVELGPGVAAPFTGTRVGIGWLHRTCGACRFCRAGRENLCELAEFTGWTVDGGFAEFAVAPAEFVHALPADVPDAQAAPLLCAGIIGWRALLRTGFEPDDPAWRGLRLGLYGFGAAGHVVLQLARARGAEVHVMTRDRERHQALAHDLGATWVGDTFDRPPVRLDAAIVFAPAGEIVPAALAALDRGGTLVLGGIHMSPLPSMPYDLLYGERTLASVANNTRDDARRFLEEAARVPVRTSVRTFPLEEANEALLALARDAIRGAGVLVAGGAGDPG